MVSPLGEPSFDMSFFIPPLDMPSFFIPSLSMPVVSEFLDPFSTESFVMPGLVMLSCCAAGPVEPCAKAEPHIRVRAAVAIRIFFMSFSVGVNRTATSDGGRRTFLRNADLNFGSTLKRNVLLIVVGLAAGGPNLLRRELP